jgi:hypothetical protein
MARDEYISPVEAQLSDTTHDKEVENHFKDKMNSAFSEADAQYKQILEMQKQFEKLKKHK